MLAVSFKDKTKKEMERTLFETLECNQYFEPIR